MQPNNAVQPEPRKTILIAEDDRMLRESLKMLFEYLGYKVFAAVNGAEALKVYEKNAGTIRVVISDVTMPVMNGIELCRRIRQQNSTVPIVVAAGYPTVLSVSELTSLKVNAYLAKPVVPKRLRQLVDRLLKEPVESSVQREAAGQRDNPKPVTITVCSTQTISFPDFQLTIHAQ